MTALQSRAVHADLDTPVGAYLKLRGQHRWSFLFESVEGQESWAAYSVLGFGARKTVRHGRGHVEVTGPGTSPRRFEANAPLATLRAERRPSTDVPRDAPPFVGGLFGVFAYDAVRTFERLPSPRGDAGRANALFFEPELLAVFDNRRHSVTLYAEDPQRLDEAVVLLRGAVPSPAPFTGPSTEPTPLTSRQDFCGAVEAAKEHIRAGDIIQVVLSRCFELPAVADPFEVYRGLRTINPSPYMYFVDTPEVTLAGASPEVMLRIANGRAVVRPIAGTRPRGGSTESDAAHERDLLADPKERAEHVMLVDLGRNDLGRVCTPGSVHVDRLMTVERYSHVMHLVSEVSGQLRPDADAFAALRATFPAGTLSGAPKVRAMQLIDALEQRPRGFYGGAVGYFGPNGDADFGICIRTLVQEGGRWTVQAGAGIVADSVPEREADETEHKARVVLRAAAWAAGERRG